MTEAWRHRATSRAARTAAVWINTMLTGAVSGAAIAISAQVDGTARIVALAVALSAGVACVVIGTHVYMATIDEQERDANLWGAYAGIVAYLSLFLIERTAFYTGHRIPFASEAIFTIVCLVIIIVFLRKRFR